VIDTGKSYIGKTQQFLKKRTSDHIADVWKRVEAKKNNKTYKKDDSFSRHFSTYCFDCTNSNQVRTKLKGILDVNILWQGKRIQCMKTARTRDCRICIRKVQPPASPDASLSCQQVTPESDESSLGSLLHPNLKQAQREWADRQARALTSEMEAESFDC